MATREQELTGCFPDGSVDGVRAAEFLGVAHGTVKRWLREGLPCRRQNHRVFIFIDEARAWVAQRYPNTIAVNRRSYIYFAARATDGAIKIGWSSDVIRRMQELRKRERCPVDLLACVPGSKPDELALHERFKSCALELEWFRPTKALTSFIEGLLTRAA